MASTLGSYSLPPGTSRLNLMGLWKQVCAMGGEKREERERNAARTWSSSGAEPAIAPSSYRGLSTGSWMLLGLIYRARAPYTPFRNGEPQKRNSCRALRSCLPSHQATIATLRYISSTRYAGRCDFDGTWRIVPGVPQEALVAF